MTVIYPSTYHYQVPGQPLQPPIIDRPDFMTLQRSSGSGEGLSWHSHLIPQTYNLSSPAVLPLPTLLLQSSRAERQKLHRTPE